jgi:DNA-directed RNA polymerase specialized sigma24 family protein/ribosome-associated translation inhibitor RaiA
MNVHFGYKISKTPDIEKEVNHNISKLQKWLPAFRPELIHLKGYLEQNSVREGVIASLNLRLPSGQMAVQQSAATGTAALKAAFSDLFQQLNKHKDLLRRSHKWKRRGAEEKPGQQVAFEDTLAAVQPLTASSEDIRSYVNANLARLNRFVERELYFRENSGQIPARSIDKEEVIDEAIARALGDGAEKPERLGVEPWLYRLATRVINELSMNDSENASELRLSDSAWKPNVHVRDEAALQYHQPDEGLTGENIIPDTRLATPEEIAYSDEMITLVQFALASVKPVDRNAFLLFAIEGFSADEISAITDQPLESVKSSIAIARQHLRSSPPIPNPFKTKLLQRTGTG